MEVVVGGGFTVDTNMLVSIQVSLTHNMGSKALLDVVSVEP